ncbi:MAG TPA: hypothetical protein VG276_28665 [Actinomycetes bacterium]|jgi:hypothetical protein|nr:hypothetical protein [Actinomycetes bacterium]
MNAAVDPPVVMVSPTVMDGTVVRWYRSVAAAEISRASLSASCRGVAVHEELLTDVPPAWVEQAVKAYQTLAANPRADLGGLATHHHRRFMNGPIVPVAEGAST